jgi:hypothetical protein
MQLFFISGPSSGAFRLFRNLNYALNLGCIKRTDHDKHHRLVLQQVASQVDVFIDRALCSNHDFIRLVLKLYGNQSPKVRAQDIRTLWLDWSFTTIASPGFGGRTGVVLLKSDDWREYARRPPEVASAVAARVRYSSDWSWNERSDATSTTSSPTLGCQYALA